jgi:hypothetical protein
MPIHDARTEEIARVTGTEEDIAKLQHHLKEVLEGHAFKGSPRSAQFLKHIIDQAIAGHFDSLKERVIGMEVFGRSASYDTGEDAIVRVTASDVRKRLLQHYGQPGASSEYRISLPSGSYVPKITYESHPQRDPSTQLATHLSPTAPQPESTAADQDQPVHPGMTITSVNKSGLSPDASKKKGFAPPQWIFLAALFTIFNVALSFAFWTHARHVALIPSSTLPWSAFFNSARPTQLITSDPNIAEIQGFTGGQISLSDYANHKYIPDPNGLTPEQLRFCVVILRGDKASVVDTPIAVNIALLAQENSKKISVHGARDIQLVDLKADQNLILLGSPRSNPWVNLFNDRLDFRFEFDKALGAEIIRNVRPQSGEPQSYIATAAGWATGQSYAIIAFMQNPDQNGEVILIAGENGEGTEAAGRLLNDTPRLASNLTRCGISPTGPSRHFELLLHLNTMAGSPSNVDAVACHVL